MGSRYATGNWVWNVDGYSQSRQHSPGSSAAGNGYITQESDDGQYGNIAGYMCGICAANMTWGRRGQI